MHSLESPVNNKLIALLEEFSIKPSKSYDYPPGVSYDDKALEMYYLHCDTGRKGFDYDDEHPVEHQPDCLILRAQQLLKEIAGESASE